MHIFEILTWKSIKKQKFYTSYPWYICECYHWISNLGILSVYNHDIKNYNPFNRFILLKQSFPQNHAFPKQTKDNYQTMNKKSFNQIYIHILIYIVGTGLRCAELFVLCLTVCNKSTWTTVWTCLQRSANFRHGDQSFVLRWYSIFSYKCWLNNSKKIYINKKSC